ncbi:sulfate adenylyltransferase [Candidatus Dojkabacteria bacterium]|uniref:Adenylyl-sulfate kinase n=1 Tax=Candidatus Dojkabacteria bacterium TaxID=2099670 RepID=A0A955RKN4_9BACT|nr:sulfate adenylyltransferase [Candidatus Dojkabacteria bacterium]
MNKQFPLVNRILSLEQADVILSSLRDYKTITLESIEQKKDIRNIATGVYSPLTGFLRKKEFKSVLTSMRLTDGNVWSIPIVLDIDKKKKKELDKEKSVIILDHTGNPFALLSDIEIYSYDQDLFVEAVFGTNDKLHPGVEDVYQMKDYLIGGDISLLVDDKELFPEHNFTPEETRRIFKGRGWQTIAGFQTRNVPHRGHEHIQMQALKEIDGLFVHPVIGEKKLDDFKDEYIISAYEVLIDKYYPKNKAFLGILPLKMRYAGPREAIMHALIRRNFGCTHFIVGRDHAGVGNYYGRYDAQEIFNQISKEDLGIEILKFEGTVVDKKTKEFIFSDDDDSPEVISISGTKMRNWIKEKQQPPEYILRPEVYAILTEKKNVLVDDLYKRHQHTNFNNHRGFVLWFTGLSQSGKSTISERLYELLEDKGVPVELLDGDVVRESLSSDLSFSKEDRDQNIKRVGFVAKLLSRNNVAVLCSFISPYEKQRQSVRLKVENFIEVYVNTPLEVCERRDRKGFYAKARSGEIKNFTGISAPYEEPKKPEIELHPAEQGVDECVEQVLRYLSKHNFV